MYIYKWIFWDRRLSETENSYYSAEIVPKGILLSVKQVSGSDIYTESCICSAESFDKAKAFMKYISENSIGVGCWYDILHDMEMKYTVV